MRKTAGIIMVSFGVIGLVLWGNHLLSILAQLVTLAILASVDWIFAKSLAKNQVAIITRYAYLIDGELSDARIRYTRKVTLSWVFLFTLFIVIKLIVLFYHFQDWVLPQLLVYMQFSLFIGFAALFLGEYALRQHLFGKASRSGTHEETFFSFLKKVAKIPIHEVFKNDFSNPQK